jgi:uncharacterized protein YdhG (YjbR/CyaY superfamily)
VSTIEDALAAHPEPERAALQHVIDIGRAIAPDAEDGVSYGVPALRVAGKPLVGVGVGASHLAVYPFSPAAIDAVRDELAGFAASKGTIRFTAERPLPDPVLRRLVEARLAEITAAP